MRAGGDAVGFGRSRQIGEHWNKGPEHELGLQSLAFDATEARASVPSNAGGIADNVVEVVVGGAGGRGHIAGNPIGQGVQQGIDKTSAKAKVAIDDGEEARVKWSDGTSAADGTLGTSTNKLRIAAVDTGIPRDVGYATSGGARAVSQGDACFDLINGNGEEGAHAASGCTGDL